ncbi:MAG: hypothetical protein ACR652_14400 [Methylocystis sp.]|uniref:hypothetical protein n=1 Tax=Methylocystis sp. TaxID=1911079 RepID=UPI003DA610A9
MVDAMLRLLTRFLGLLLLAGGFIALIVDGTRSIAGGQLLVTTLRRGLSETTPALYKALEADAGAKSAYLLDAVSMLMALPISLTLGTLGALLIVFSHKQEADRYWRR